MAVAIDVTPRETELERDSQRDVRAKTIVVFDAIGEVFARLRALELPVALWRIGDASRTAPDVEADMTICAAYAPVEWDGLPLADHDGSRVVVTTVFRMEEAEEALDHGLAGYLDASKEADVLVRAIRGVLLNGECAFPREAIGHWMRARQNGHTGNGLKGLTGRQQEIVRLIARGATDKEIAGELGIAPGTAQKHVTNILQRLHVPNRAAAVAMVAARERN